MFSIENREKEKEGRRIYKYNGLKRWDVLSRKKLRIHCCENVYHYEVNTEKRSIQQFQIVLHWDTEKKEREKHENE